MYKYLAIVFVVLLIIVLSLMSREFLDRLSTRLNGGVVQLSTDTIIDAKAAVELGLADKVMGS